MKSDELREKYLDFFEARGHSREPSDVLVPTWDPSVLFTPAGMNQFKDHFLGKVKLDFTRATTCQKCLRTGDIDNVGRTAYHHTFFEMLGNFSFGDYFKREAIHWAWEFLTDKKWLGIDPERLTVSVYLDDDEASKIWADEIGVPQGKIERLDEDENFWPANAPSRGPDGVCGPCSEIFYHDDFGDEVEVWNLVFTQYHRVGTPPDNLRPLPSKNIDTGMGFERAAACLQGVQTNFHIDTLQPIVDAAAEVCGIEYEFESDTGRRLRRITDHVRACTMAVHENVYPGPNKEKYVIRRLLRRAVLDGHQMGMREPFLYQLTPVVVEMMRSAYPDLAETVDRVVRVVKQEEDAFLGTIDAGLNRIERIFDDMRREGRTMVRGDDIFFMLDTHGFPVELFEQIAAEHNFMFDWPGFREILKGRGGGRTGPIFPDGPIDALKRTVHRTEFVGYETTEAEAKVLGIIAQEHLCDQLQEEGREQEVTIVLDRTPFYGESGGQVGDSGEIVGEGFRFEVTDTRKSGELTLHVGHLGEGKISLGETIAARVDAARRQGIRRAHSATHVLHYALQKNVGSHAQQQGSKVDDDWLRFDFTNMSPVSADQLVAVESDANERIAAAEPVSAQVLPLDDARQAGAMMLFGERYPDRVRMVTMGDFSRELCGGTHLDNTGDVGSLEIVTEEGVAAGTRRIVALTGEKAKQHADKTRAALTEVANALDVGLLDAPEAVRDLVELARELKKRVSSGGKASEPDVKKRGNTTDDVNADYAQVKGALRDAARTLNVSPFDLPPRIVSLLDEVEGLKKQLAQLAESGGLSADALLDTAETVGETKAIVAETPGANPNLMRQLIDQLRKKADSTAVLLGAAAGESKVVLVAGVSRDLVKRGVSAGNWVKEVAPVVGGGGGGKPDMAQAGGKDPGKLAEALETAKVKIREMLA